MELHVLNLGAGVQSTKLYLDACDGELKIDFAIFSDTGDEPREVYEHLAWLKSLGGPEIVTVSEGVLSESLVNGIKGDGGRFASIPTFLATGTVSNGINRRQCTSEFKILPIEREIRRRLGADFGKRVPKGNTVVQYFGLSFDEPKRVSKVKLRMQGMYWTKPMFPLFDDFMTRQDCISYLQKRVPDRVVPRSACVFCQYHDDVEWMRIKADPVEWEKAIAVDRSLRDPKSVCAQGLNALQYLHRSCVPLELVELKPKPPNANGRIDFVERDCEGMCGN